MADKEERAPIVRTRDYRDIYANQTYVTNTGTDVQVLLATAAWINDALVHEQHATLFLTPVQARYLSIVLERTVQRLERQTGTKHPVPDAMTEWLNKPVEDD